MRFISTRGESPATSFRDAILSGLAPDGGLYIPEHFPQLPLVSDPASQTLHSIGCNVLSLFIDDVPARELSAIVKKAWTFPIPLRHLEENLFLLELFHGPTLAFKDVGARFLAEMLSHYLHKSQQEITIAVATSGDTGSAVAHGFFGVNHLTVYVLYPSGKISRLQEQQMTTLGKNIFALEVEGTFDDCQRLVRQALSDSDLVRETNLTTANSMNLGRLLPQVVYYVWAIAQLQKNFFDRAFQKNGHLRVVVPSGNFGNLTAAVYAQEMGTPIRQFVAATNLNDVFPKYLQTGSFIPRDSIQTISNAMDVGDPSNVVRLQALVHNSLRDLRRRIFAISISDNETLGEIKRTYEQTGIILDPHTAVGVAAARLQTRTDPIIVAATAHPAKFPEIIGRALGFRVPLPPQLKESFDLPKQSTRLAASYDSFKAFVLSEPKPS